LRSSRYRRRASVGALLRYVVELGTGERSQPAAAAMQLMERGALQDVVELGDRLLVARVIGLQLLDPSPRGRVAQAGSLDARARRRPSPAHEPSVGGQV
jgi:hypothetical protein